LVFLLGAVYRRAADPAPIFLTDAADFLTSRHRLDMEVALSGGEGHLHYRHQLLPPFALSQAIAEGLGVGVRCWSALINEPVSCDFGLLASGDITFELKREESPLVSVRMAQDALTEQDRNHLYGSFVRGASLAGENRSFYQH
jgi:hypothetical protein